MDRELNDFGSGLSFNNTSGSLSGFFLHGSDIRENRSYRAGEGMGKSRRPRQPRVPKMDGFPIEVQ